MNESQLIRRELAAQRRHAREIAASWISRDQEFSNEISDNYNSYLLLIIGLQIARIESHLERLRPRSDLSEAERGALDSHRCAFESLLAERARAFAGERVARNAEHLMQLSRIAEALDAMAESRYSVDDWRGAAHVDADSILEERRLRKQLLEQADGRASR
jgi:hypothetical protein